MENQTKKCKHCQSDIPKKAKVCPNCRRKQGGALKWVIIAFLGIGFISSIGNSDDETKTTEQVASNTNPVKVEEVKQEQPKANEANVQTEASEIAESETVVVPQETEEEYKEYFCYYDIVVKEADNMKHLLDKEVLILLKSLRDRYKRE